MDIVEANSLINSDLGRFDDSSATATIEISLKTLRIAQPKVPHSGFSSSDICNLSILPEITLEEVSNHDQPSDCWIVIYDRIYDITKFLDDHPGGEDVILDYAGRDGTLAFRGTGHSKVALKLLEQHLIGELPQHQRIFRRSEGFIIKLSDLPE